MEKGFIYRVTELNVDGCGGSAEEIVSASSPISGTHAQLFEECLLEAKKVYASQDYNTADMIEEAAKLFSDKTGIQVEVCKAPFMGNFYF